jgi:PE-PPE domain/PE family
MTYLIAEPEFMTAVAADVEQIGSAIGAANAAAAGPTSGVIAPAADEVSAAITKLFGQFGQEYRAAVAQAAVFHSQFARALTAAGGAYAAAEAAASNALGVSGAAGAAATSAQVPSIASALTDPAVSVALVMGGSGNPIPDTKFIDGVLNWATRGGFTWGSVQALFTPEQLYPLTGVRSLPLSTSVSEGVQILDAAIKQQIAAGNSVLVQSYSQSSIIASIEMQNLLASASPPTGSQLYFNLLGDPMNPNGGLLERFAGLVLPSLGLDFYGATPANTPWTTNIFSLEYDGFADFPRYPIDFLSDLNAVLGIVYVHPTYPHIDPSTLTIVQLPVSSSYTGSLANTTYYMGLTPNLPLLDPVRAIPVVGNPLADLLQPDLTYLVNWGYGNPAYGYSTAPANVPTPFGLFPPLSATTVLPGDLIAGAQQGIGAAASDLMAEGMSGLSLPSPSPSGIAHLVQSVSLPSPGTLLSPASIGGFIQTLQTTGTNVANAFSTAAADGYGVLLPTADILNAAVISIPTYDANLFLAGIAQAAAGNPVGLINAVGDPLAATTGLVTVAGGVEGLVLLEGTVGAIRALTSLIP